jgi:twitching motility protein PilJ
LTKISPKRGTKPPKLPPQKQKQQGWSLQVKTTALAIALSTLPVLAVGTASYLGSQSIYKQITQARQADATRLTETEIALQRQLLLLLIGTGVTAVLAGAIAALLANRAIHPVLNAAAVSTAAINRLRREDVALRDRVAGKDELVALETNIKLIEEQLPNLLWNQEAEAERTQVLMNITRRIWESLSEADVLKATVEEVRKAFKIDRVVVFRFDANRDGTFIEESVASNLPKMSWAKIDTPFFEGRDIEQYRNGCVLAVGNIYQADLTDSQIGLLERFAVKANLISPIIKDNQLFGLLIAHQCSEPRYWQQSEINVFAQLATQVGFALAHVELLEQVDTKANQGQVFIDISRRIRESLNEEDILKTTVEEVRKAIRTERVLVYSFDNNWYGTVIAESVLPGFPKAMWAQIKDPCFAEGYIRKYQAGRVQATNNIYAAGLTDCHLKQLEPFAVKANLVAPILKDGYLFGLLIAHECSKPREWQQSEISLFTQLATQVGFALDHAKLLQRINAEGVQTQLIAHVSRRIRESLNEEDILKTTVEEVRKAIRTERVLVYSFDNNWYGTVIAESVLPGFPKAMWAQIKDPCFAEGYIRKYQAGRVQATNNIYAAGLTDCHLKQLEPFAVKANLVAPILKDGYLFGLLIAHECSKPREWQQSEISLFTQLATQVGFALDHARLLNQVEQAYQAASATSHEQRQQKEALQRQVAELLRVSEIAVQSLSNESLSQLESVTLAYKHIQAVDDLAQKMITTVQQAELQIQQANQTVQIDRETMSRNANTIVAVRQAILVVSEKVKRLDQPAQKLFKVVNLISNVTSQLKLYAMNTRLAAARTNGDACQELDSIAEKVLSSVQQLDENTAEIQSLVARIQAEIQQAGAVIQDGTEQAIAGTQLMEETQQNLNRIAAFSVQISSLVEEIAQAANNQTQASTFAGQAILELANIASNTSEQSMSVAKSFNQLAAAAQEL